MHEKEFQFRIEENVMIFVRHIDVFFNGIVAK